MQVCKQLHPLHQVDGSSALVPSVWYSKLYFISLLRAVIEGLWLRFQGEQVEVCVRREQRRRILQTLVWFVITLILALFIPDIGRVISMIGGLAACFIFVFPGTTTCFLALVLLYNLFFYNTILLFLSLGLCLMQAKLSETDNRTARWDSVLQI